VSAHAAIAGGLVFVGAVETDLYRALSKLGVGDRRDLR
jgi:hypothetical protein